MQVRVAAATVPVVFATGSDPVSARLVASLNRPGGNLTGVTVITATLWPKRLELVRDLISPAPLIALLINPNNLTATPARRELSAAAREIGQNVIVLDASVEGDFGAAFATLAKARQRAYRIRRCVVYEPTRSPGRPRRAPCHTYDLGRREFASAGGLMSYGASTVDQYYQSGVYVAVFSKAKTGRSAIPAADQV